MPMTRRDLLKLGAAGGLATLLGREAAASRAGAGRIYAVASILPGDRMTRSLLAINPEFGTWSQVWSGADHPATVSPDGRWLVTVASSDQAPERDGVWLVDLTAPEPPRRLTETPGHPVWSPDGTELILSSDTDAGYTVRRLKADGSGSTPLPIRDPVIDWSRDARWLLVNRREDDVEPSAAMSARYLVHPDGTDARLLTRGHDEGDDRYVARWQHRFLADGDVVFFQATESLCNLWRIGPDGGLPRLLVPERADDAPFHAVGSPDGSRLAVMYFDRAVGEDGQKNDVIRGRHLEVLNLADGSARPIPLPDTEDLWLVDWLA